jgi:ADP-ribosylglycohydrolase
VHNPLDSADLARDELRQRRESGYDVGRVEAMVSRWSSPTVEDWEQVYEALLDTERRENWPYVEPAGLAEITAAWPPTRPDRAEVRDDLEDRVLGGWVGRIAGCTMGKPIEDGDHWTPERIRAYLERAGAYPLRDYVPRLEPMPAGYRLRECWPETTRGRIAVGPRDDDIDYSILALLLLEAHGADLRREHVAAAMLTFLPYLRIFTAERAAMVNLLHNVSPPSVADVRNPYREWIGALIRADVYGWAHPGQPSEAARLAYADASLTHRANGVYGAMWVAALVALAGVSSTISDAVLASLSFVPERSRLAEALRSVVGWREAGHSWERALILVRQRYGHYGWVHVINNACVITAGLLWGEEDFAATVGLTVQAGWDTDSNGATAGSVAGTVLGARRLPPHLIEPLHDRVRSAIFGHDNAVISHLASRTALLARGWRAPGAWRRSEVA